MGTGYTRNDTGNNIADGNVIDAADLDGEFDAVQAAFNASTGHSHDGTTGEGPQIDTAGLQNAAVTRAKIENDAVDSTKLDETDSSYVVAGLDTTGTITVDTIGEHTAAAGVTVDGVVLKDGGVTVTGDLSFGDNDKAIFGAGGDLQIYHSSTTNNSIIAETGGGYLTLNTNGSKVALYDTTNSQQLADFNTGGSVDLYHNGSKKLATTSTGIDVTGTVTADKAVLSLANNDPLSLENTSGTRCRIQMATTSSHAAEIELGDGSLKFKNTSSDLERLRIAANGDIFFYEDTGTNPRINYDASTQFVVNEDSANFDFRVESDSNAHMLFVDGGNNRVGIGTGSPNNSLDVRGFISLSDGSNRAVIINNTSDGSDTGDFIACGGGGASTSRGGFFRAFGNEHATDAGDLSLYTGDVSTSKITFRTNSAERMRIDSSGNVGIGTSSPAKRLDIRVPYAGNPTTPTGIRVSVSSLNEDQYSARLYTGVNNGGAPYTQLMGPKDVNGWLAFTMGSSDQERMRIAATGTLIHKAAAVFNEDGGNSDFRVESDTSTHALFVDASANKVGINTSVPGTTLDIEGSLRVNYCVPTNAGGTSTGATAQWVKLGRLTIDGSKAAQIKIYGTQSYSAGSNISGISYLNLRGNNSATTMEGHFYSETQGNGPIMDAGFVYVSSNVFDIYAEFGTFHSLELTVTTSGSWDDSYYYLTGSTTDPSGIAKFDSLYNFWNGYRKVVTHSSGETIFNEDSHNHDFRVESDNNANAIRVDADTDNVYFGKGASGTTTDGIEMKSLNTTHPHLFVTHSNTSSTAAGIYINRQAADGQLIAFRQANNIEGNISVSGSTVSYNGFSGNHESSGIPASTQKGTVVSTIDELDVYVEGPKQGQTRTDHAKIEVSNTVSDPAVYGVLLHFNEEGKAIITSVGIGSVLVTGACAKGDLLESNGDGTARVQDDDIVRSKTLGKVTIGNSDTGVKLVSCVMYCG